MRDISDASQLQSVYDLSICYQFSPVSISARGGCAPQIEAQLNVSALRLRRLALTNIPQISLYAVSSLLSQFSLGVDGRRAFKRNSMVSCFTRVELLWKASLRSPYMLSVLFCLNFCSGWMGAARSSATQCFHSAPAALCQNCPVRVSGFVGSRSRVTAVAR